MKSNLIDHKLTSAELIDLVANKLRTQILLSIAEELGIDNTLINLPFISYPESICRKIYSSSIILKVNSFLCNQII